jgi:hypothetical protein
MGDDEMLEFGTVHDGVADVDFDEWWDRVDASTTWAVYDGFRGPRRCARVVQVGRFATTHEDRRPTAAFQAALWQFDAGDWRPLSTLGGDGPRPGGRPGRPAPPIGVADLSWTLVASGEHRRADA